MCDYISFDKAVVILRDELNYPADRALYFVKKFDHNNDGKLDSAEFNQFKTKIEETKRQLTPEFKKFDTSGDGYISLAEAAKILQKSPYNFPSDKVLILLKKFDKDGNGKLDIEEFADFYAETKATNDNITRKFDELDKDGNGILCPDEVTSVLQEMLGLDKEMAQFMIQMFDTNNDGNIDKTEFVTMWSSMFGNI